MILSDGVFLDTYLGYPACTYRATTNTELPIYNVCGIFYLDTDGYKGENTVAKDIFEFWITKQGQIVPFGTPEDTSHPISDCAMNQSGWGCAAWVIYKENMDYLKGKTVAW